MYDKCERCGQLTMPKWHKEGKATARACQNPECRRVEERSK